MIKDEILNGNPEIVDAVYEIENDMKSHGPGAFVMPTELSPDINNFLNHAVEDENIRFKLTDSSFDEYYRQIIRLMYIKFPYLRHFDFYSPTFIDIAQISIWLVIYNLITIEERDIELKKTRDIIYDKLSILFTGVRQQLLSMGLKAPRDLVSNWSFAVAAHALTMVLHEFSTTILAWNWVFTARLEGDVREILNGFQSPDIHFTHEIIYSMLPIEIAKLVPKVLGPRIAKSPRRNQQNSRDLMVALTMERRYTDSWRVRRNCLFQSNTHTPLVTRAMSLRGSTAPNSSRKYIVPKGSAERSGLTVVKTGVVIRQAGLLVHGHDDEKKATVESLYQSENECLMFLKRGAEKQHAICKPLGFTFSSFENSRTRQRSQKAKDDIYKDIPLSEIVRRQSEEMKLICNQIKNQGDKMWNMPRAGTPVEITRDIMQEYFNPTLTLRSNPRNARIQRS